MNKLFFFDTETTGIGDDAKIIQFAGYSSEMNMYIDRFFDPSPTEIEIGAMATHNITPDMVQGKEPFSCFVKALDEISEKYVMVAHNAPFDVGRIMFEGAKKPERVIDTLRIAKHTLGGKAEKFNLSYLRYYYKLYDLGDIRAHDALSDVIMLEKVFERLSFDFFQKLNIDEKDVEFGIEKMIEYSKKPVLLCVCPFGRHRGKDMSDVPKRWLEWALRDIKDLDPDTKHTFEYYI